MYSSALFCPPIHALAQVRIGRGETHRREVGIVVHVPEEPIPEVRRAILRKAPLEIGAFIPDLLPEPEQRFDARVGGLREDDLRWRAARSAGRGCAAPDSPRAPPPPRRAAPRVPRAAARDSQRAARIPASSLSTFSVCLSSSSTRCRASPRSCSMFWMWARRPSISHSRCAWISVSFAISAWFASGVSGTTTGSMRLRHGRSSCSSATLFLPSAHDSAGFACSPRRACDTRSASAL